MHIPYLPAPRHAELHADYRFTPPPKIPGDLEGKPVMRRPVEKVNTLDLEGVGPEPREPCRGQGRDASSVVRASIAAVARRPRPT